MKRSSRKRQPDEHDDLLPARAPRPIGPRVAPVKQSYESNPDVQRWVRQQDSEHDAGELRFDPLFLASRRDGFWVRSSLAVFYQQELITDVIGQASSGKEATVYCCTAHPSTGVAYLAAKVYRPRMFRSLRNDAVYREGRATLDSSGRARNARRARREAEGDGERGRALQVSSWITSEYRVQRRLYEAGAAVPRPLSQIGNAILMDFVGAQDEPAPRLKDADLPPAQAAALFDALLADVRRWIGQHCIHGDLSEYNILYADGRLTTIDFAQAVDPRHSAAAYELLARDLARVCSFFGRYGVRADPAGLAGELWSAYLLGELEADG